MLLQLVRVVLLFPRRYDQISANHHHPADDEDEEQQQKGNNAGCCYPRQNTGGDGRQREWSKAYQGKAT
jgi:hypothetical protein